MSNAARHSASSHNKVSSKALNIIIYIVVVTWRRNSGMLLGADFLHRTVFTGLNRDC